MKMFRKIICVLMCIAVLFMAGCSKKPAASDNNNEAAKETEKTVYSVPAHDG